LVLNFDHNREDRFAGISHILQRLQSEASADIGSGWHWCGKADAIQAVIDDHAGTVSDLEGLLGETTQQGQGQEAVRDGGAIGRVFLRAI